MPALSKPHPSCEYANMSITCTGAKPAASKAVAGSQQADNCWPMKAPLAAKFSKAATPHPGALFDSLAGLRMQQMLRVQRRAVEYHGESFADKLQQLSHDLFEVKANINLRWKKLRVLGAIPLCMHPGWHATSAANSPRNKGPVSRQHILLQRATGPTAAVHALFHM